MDPARFFAASRTLIVAGKGGVGKSTVAAACARAAGRAGLRAVLVRLTPGPEPEPVPTLVVTPDRALREYLDDHGLARMTGRLMSSGAIDVVTAAAPGIKDLLVLGRVKQLERSGEHDLVVVDAPAAGHAVEFLRAPRLLRAAVGTGPIATQADDVLAMLADPERCRVALVTTPEETPVNELIETAYALEDEIGIDLAPVIVNAVLDPIEGLLTDVAPEASSLGLSVPDVDALDAAARFHRTTVAAQQAQLDRISADLPLDAIRLPLLSTTRIGDDDLDVLVSALTTAIDALPEPTR